MQKTSRMSKWLWVLLIIAAVALAGCSGTQPKPGEVFECAADDKLEVNIGETVSLEDFSCVFKRWEGKDTLHFNVAVKNSGDEPMRYKVNIFLDNGKAVGGLIPRKTKKGLVKPGQTASFVYPVGNMTKKPKGVTLNIMPMSK